MVLINPGTGHVSPTRLQWANSSMDRFVRELGVSVNLVRRPKDDGEGWFGYTVARRGRLCRVQMPGVGFARIHPWGQRLYVDGSSWFWPYALEMVKDALEP